MKTLSFAVPAEVETPNWRTTWGHRAAIADRVRRAVKSSVPDRPDWPTYSIAITRVGPNALDDDNLVAACKAARDELAAWLGLDDADPRLTWTYRQRRERILDPTPRAKRLLRTWLEVTVSPAPAETEAQPPPARLEREKTRAPTRTDQDRSQPTYEATVATRANGSTLRLAKIEDVHGSRYRLAVHYTQQGHAWRTTGVAIQPEELAALAAALERIP